MGSTGDSDDLDFTSELVFNATRSSGPGGQHVNKVSSRVELRFDVRASRFLSEEEKETILHKLAGRISKEGVLLLACQAGRSQHENRTKVISRFHDLIHKALTPDKPRVRTRPSTRSKEKRLEVKHLLAEKKSRRNPVKDE